MAKQRNNRDDRFVSDGSDIEILDEDDPDKDEPGDDTLEDEDDELDDESEDDDDWADEEPDEDEDEDDEDEDDVEMSFSLSTITGDGALIFACCSECEAAEQMKGKNRFRKELVRAGRWHMPGRGVVTITPDDVKRFAHTFQQMKKNGLRVPLPLGHTTDPEKGRGWVEDMQAEGDKLYGVVRLSGSREEAKRLAESVDVSIYAPKVFKDGKGNVYKWPITHVALVTDPVVQGLGEFEHIAASLSGTSGSVSKGPVQVLSYEGTSAMDRATMCKICDMLGIPHEGKTDEEVQQALTAAVGAMKAKAEGGMPGAEGGMGGGIGMGKQNYAAMSRRLKRAESRVRELEEEALQMSRGEDTNAVEVDEDLMESEADVALSRLDILVSRGHITPKAAELLADRFIGTEDRNAVCLSRKVASKLGMDKSIIKGILDVLEVNRPVELDIERTGGQQPIVLGRTVGGDRDYDDTTNKRMAKDIAERQGTPAAA